MSEQEPIHIISNRTLVWFSCGAASACALKLSAHLNPVAVYCDLSSDEHPDNQRFLRDVEVWTGVSITTIRSKTYSSVRDVFNARRYMSGMAGAPCTVEMKKVPRFDFQQADDTHIFGYTVEETNRIERFEASNPDMLLRWPLEEAGMTKDDCLKMIADAGIELPAMYKLGFRNNNCIGCVKATSPKYWNLIRANFPERFNDRAEQSRRIGCRLVRVNGQRIFLDELPIECNDGIMEDLSCGPQCQLEFSL